MPYGIVIDSTKIACSQDNNSDAMSIIMIAIEVLSLGFGKRFTAYGS